MTEPEAGPDVVVVGAGIAGLVLARDLAARGARVTVLEAAPAPGGCVAAHEVAGLRLDAGAESFATRGGVVRALVDELGLSPAVVTPARSGAWVHLPDRTVPLPAAGLLGIPGDLRAHEVRRAVGRLGVARATLDRYLPARVGLPSGPTTVAALVRARMGRRVLDRLVGPVVAGVYSTPPDLADLDTVLPGVRALLRETGSLAAAVTGQRAAAPAGSAVAGLVGGMNRLVSALTGDLASRGVDLRTGTAVVALTREPATGPRPGPGPGPGPDAGPGEADDGAWRLALAGGGSLTARSVALAVPGPTAARLLGALVPQVRALAGAGPDVVLATLVLDAPALDVAPRGTGVLVAEGAPGVGAKALTHGTAKWAWLAEAAGPGRHVVRLSYGRGSAPPQFANMSADREHPKSAIRRHVRDLRGGVRDLGDEELAAQALADTAILLGVRLVPEQVVGFARTRWSGAVPSARPGRRDDVARLRAALGAHPGLFATGAWLAGTGLAAVVADARALAARLPLEARG